MLEMFMPVFRGKRSKMLGLRQLLFDRVNLLKHGRKGLGISKVGSECWCCTGSHRKIAHASSFVSRNGLPKNTALLGYALR